MAAHRGVRRRGRPRARRARVTAGQDALGLRTPPMLPCPEMPCPEIADLRVAPDGLAAPEVVSQGRLIVTCQRPQLTEFSSALVPRMACACHCSADTDHVEEAPITREVLTSRGPVLKSSAPGDVARRQPTQGGDVGGRLAYGSDRQAPPWDVRLAAGRPSHS